LKLLRATDIYKLFNKFDLTRLVEICDISKLDVKRREKIYDLSKLTSDESLKITKFFVGEFRGVCDSTTFDDFILQMDYARLISICDFSKLSKRYKSKLLKLDCLTEKEFEIIFGCSLSSSFHKIFWKIDFQRLL